MERVLHPFFYFLLEEEEEEDEEDSEGVEGAVATGTTSQHPRATQSGLSWDKQGGS